MNAYYDIANYCYERKLNRSRITILIDIYRIKHPGRFLFFQRFKIFANLVRQRGHKVCFGLI